MAWLSCSRRLLARIKFSTVPEVLACSVVASGMVNYCLQKFLPHPERQQVGVDEQLANTVPAAVDLDRVHARGISTHSLFLSAPDSAEGSRSQSDARPHPQPGID